MCRCGCNGACTLDGIQMEMNWSLNALQQDTFMSSRFDKKPWLPSEASRRARAGCKMGFRGVVNEYRADLPDRCAAAKIKTQGGHYACLWCMQKAAKLYDGISATSIASCPWVLRTQDSYLDEISTHLISVHVQDIAERRALASSLVWCTEYPWGRRVQGSKGARWGLTAND